MINVEKILKDHNIDPKIAKDQFFLVDESIQSKIVDITAISKKDRVLEVGPGLGILTKELAQRGKEVVTIEIDNKFKPILDNMPSNVEVIYGDAYKLLNDKQFRNRTEPFTKTVSSIPYSQAQNMLHNYTNYDWFQGDIVWLAPASLAEKVNEEPILGAYFEAEIKEIVDSSSFYPKPNTTSAIIYFKRITDPKETKDFGIYFRRWLYDHEGWKVKNALREGIIKAAHDIKEIRVTKNQARGKIAELKIPNRELEKLTNNIRIEYYFEIPEKLKDWFNNLS